MLTKIKIIIIQPPGVFFNINIHTLLQTIIPIVCEAWHRLRNEDGNNTNDTLPYIFIIHSTTHFCHQEYKTDDNYWKPTHTSLNNACARETHTHTHTHTYTLTHVHTHRHTHLHNSLINFHKNALIYKYNLVPCENIGPAIVFFNRHTVITHTRTF
jgi:hypothetical protein